MSAETRITELGLELPAPQTPAGTYVPVVQVGNLLFTSGHAPQLADDTVIQGRIGDDLTEEQGNQAARAVGMCVLATIRDHLGSLDRVERLVKTLGMVNAVSDFRDHTQVINGFSDLMADVFGDAGRGARSAVGMGSLPQNIAVEIEAIFQIKE